MPTPTGSPETPEPAQRAGSGRSGRRRDRTQHDRRHGEDVVSDEPDSQGETLARARGDSRGQRPADHLTHRPRNASRPPLRRRRRGAPAWAALLATVALLAAVALLPPAAPAQAQTTTVLVSNIGQTGSGGLATTRRFGATFTTGSTAATLTSIELRIDNSTSAAVTTVPTVHVHTGTETGGFLTLGTEVAELTGPSSLAAGIHNYTFMAPANTTLEASSTYYVIMGVVGASVTLRYEEDDGSSMLDSGGASGWDLPVSYASGADLQVNSGALRILMRVNGTVSLPPGTAMTLVSNVGQGFDKNWTGSADRSQPFTTGATDATLSSVEIGSEDGQGDPIAISVCTVDANDHPTSDCTALVAPASFAAGTVVFTAPDDTTLNANTTYTLLVTGPNPLLLDATSADNEDAGGVTGWSLQNTFDVKSTSNVWSGNFASASLRITIKGTADPATNSAPTVATEIPDQTAMSGTAFSYEVPAATFTDADGDTLTYMATLDDDSMLPSWLSFDAATRTFSGTPTTAETVSVKVTASDASDSVSDTFDIVVGLPTLVSNAIQVSDNSWNTSDNRSQPFTTGAVGATLSSVEIISEDTAGDDVAVSLCTVDGSNHPTSDCTPLTAPSSFAAGTLVFTAPDGTTLAATTTYTLSITSTAAVNLDATSSNNEDDGGVTGWSIADSSDYETSSNVWTPYGSLSLRITIKGTITTNTAPTVATEIPNQTAMSGTAFSYQVPAATFADADSDTLTYAATLADDAALPAWLSFAPATRTFSGTPTTAETVSVKVTASDASDSVSDTFDIVVGLPADTSAPRVASIVRETPTSSPTNADSLTWRVTFSEAVSNVDAADFVVSGTTATVTVAAVSGVTGGYDVTASGGDLASVNGTVALTISSSHNIEDGASNDLTNTAPTGTNDNSYVLDNTAPSVTISGVPAISDAPFTATFTFSEAVTGFAVGDITLGNATASNFTTMSTTVYTALVTPTAAGAVTVDVSANAAEDAVSNGNTAATRASSTFTLPAITITAGTSPVTEGTSAVFTLSRTGSTTAALTVNVTVSETGGDMVAASNEGARTVTFLANATTATLSVTTASDSVDEANSVVTATISADTGSPASYSVGTPASAMVTVEDNDTRDVTVSTTALTINEGATGTYTVVLDSQPTASVMVTPSKTGSSDVTFSPPTLTFTTSNWSTAQTVTVTTAQDSDAVDDSATISHAVTGGDYASLTVDSVVVTVDDDETADTTAPTVASIVRQVPTSSPTNADSLTWRVTFSEAVSNVDAADFAVSGTTATVTVAAVSGVTGAYDVTASGGNLASVSATVTLTIASSHNIEDGASNDLSNTAPTGTNNNSYVLDNAAPSVTISGVPSASNAPFTATFTFSEAVTGFAAGDITLGNATASSFTSTSTTVYTALITPTAAGEVTVDVPANAAEDAVSNGNTAATRASSTFTLPAITITAGTSPVTEGTSAVFTLSRTGSTTAALTVNVTVSETGGDMVAAANEGARTVNFLANATTATLSVTTASDSVDEANSVVTATISADTGSPASYSVGTPASAMVTVEDNDTRDVTVSTTALTINEGATGTYTVVLDSQPTASVMVTPSKTGSSDVTFSPPTLTFTTSNWSTAQTVTVTTAQDSDAVDDSATISHAVTGGDYASLTVDSVVVTVDDDETADTTAPTVASIVRQVPTSSPTNADSLTWRVTFSEAVSNVDAADFAVSGTTATVTVAAVSGVTGAYDVTASGGNLASVSATVTLTIASSHNIEDGASNDLSNTAPTGTNNNSYVLDNAAPSVTISGVPSASNAPFTATFTFSEAVTLFVVGDITLGNATASSFTSTSTTVYTALITPTAAGEVTVDVPANAAQDAVTNGNTAATQASSTYTLPVIATGICSRTAEVQTALLDATSRTACADVTAADLVAVTSLTVNNYSGTVLDPADFAGLTGLTNLLFGGSPQLTTLPDNAFAGVTALTLLDFNSLVTVTMVAEDAFSGLTALRLLSLSGNDLTTLDEDTFDGLTALRVLDLSFTSLESLDADIFDGLTALEELDLSFSSMLAALDEDTFDGLTALRVLDLSFTSLESLDADIFDGLTALSLLSLSGNSLTTLDADIFDGLTALGRLELQGNRLTALDADIFDGLTALIYVFLSANLLTTLDADIFDGLTALQEISLDRNSLDTLDADIFDGLTALEELQLHDNRLTALDANIFEDLTALELLDLNCNYFTALDFDIFDPFAATLTSLDLRSDSFTTPPTDAAIRAKFTNIDTVFTGSKTCERVTVSPTSLTVTEGATGTLSVALRSLPTDVVTLAISSDNPDVTVTPTTALTFTVANWDTAQTVTVSAAQDPDQADESATLILDPHGDGNVYPFVFSTALTVTVTDDDTDTTAPRVASIARQNPTSSPTNADSLTWRVTFSEAVSNVNAADFVVSGTTATVTAVAAVSGVTGAYDVTASGGNLASVSATVALTIAASHDIEDGASNALSNRTPTGTNNNSYVLDNTAPSVTISGVPASSDAPFRATFTFSEAVTGFAAGDITLTNASASSFTVTSTMVFTALITPAVSGTVTVDVSANAAQDAAGNGNTAAARATSTYTGTAALPAITIAAGASPVTEGTSAVFTLSRTGSTTDALTVNVTVSEAGGDMVAASNEGDRTVTFLTNSTTVTLSIATASDSVAEANSVVTATISADTGSPASYSVGAPGSAMVTVRDDDSNITVPGAPTALSATAAGGTQINLSWTAPTDDGGSPIIGYKIEVSPDGNADWTELVANTGNANTTYEHIGLTVGTSRHYRVSAINSDGVGDPSNIDDATASVPTVTLRTQSVPESIGTAMLVVTLDQPASAPLSVPWYTLSSTAASPGDYTNGAGTLIIPSGVTNATISITITDDAVEEPTETVLVLLSSGTGYDLGGSGATLSILDDDGDGPAPSGATVDGATVVLTYNEPLDGASTPSSTAFVLRVAGDPVSITEVSVDGSEVTLTLAAPVPAGQTVSLDYTQPMSNPIQDGSGKKAQSFTRWYLVTESTSTITNPVITVPGAPTALSATAVGNTQINLSWTAPGENGGAPISGYKIEVSPDGNADWTVLVANTGTTTYAHIGLAVGTTRHYRVSAINSVGAGAPSNIDDAIASIPSLSLRTQSIPEGIGTAAVLVTLNQPAGDPLSVPWYTLNGDAVSPGDYTAGAGQLIIPSGATSATISITIIDDADAEATETVLVLLSPGEGYALGGSGATLSILDDDGDGPAPSGATVNGTTVVLTYNKSLNGASTPSSTAFVLRVAGDPVSINEVSVDGSEVTLTLASPVQAGQTVSLDYTQPMSNPIQDGSGNKAQSFTRWYLVTGSTITGTVDNTAPRVASIVRETPTSSPTNADSLTWRVTFSEAVSNVDAADFVVSGTTATVTAVAAVSGVTGGYDVTASGGNLAGVSATVGLAIASSHNIQDGASNALSNTAPTGTNDNSYVVDNTAPTVTISDVPATSDAPFTATFTFPEAVTGFAVGDITLGNATASSFTVTSTTVYRALVTPTAAGAVTVDVPANAAQDAAGNGNTAATRASSTYTGSATRGVTVSATVLTVNEGTTGTYTVVLNSQPTASVTVTPSRTGSSDVTFSPPTLTFTASTWDTVQQVTVTAAQDSDAVDDSATISHAVTGGDYVGVTVESVVVTVDDDETADSTAPRVASIVRETPTSSPTNADSLTWRVTFSEAVSNVDAADFVVSGTTATVTAVAAVSGVTGAYDVTASGGNLAGVSATVTLTISSSHNIADAATNALTNTAPTGTNNNSYVLDNTAPSVTISGVPSASDAPFTATFTFSEAVTGFAAGDITLTNASASSFTSTSTMVFTALVTPTAAGAVTVDVSANAAQDAAGNGNTAATRATSTYTGTAALPAITIAAGASPVTEGTSAVFTLSRTGSTTDALTVNVTVSEAGGDMVAASNEGARTVTFLANSATATLSVATVPDSIDEANSVVTATVSADTGSPASYSVGAPGSAMVTVRDDDSNITVPGAPTDLSASSGGNTRINLSWTAPGDDGGSPIIGYKIEVSPDGNANWTELVATGNTTTTYAHIGLAVGTTRHYRVSAINSAGAGDPSNIDDATVIITTVTLRTQSIPEGIGTAAVLVTLNQPAGDPLSVPWYTLNGDAVSPGDYTAGAGQLIIPSGATSATISITIIDDADAEATETVLVLLSPGEGYVLGGSGATLSILDDDGAGPAPIRATVNGTTVVLTYNKPLDGVSTPSSTAFHLRVADNRASVDEVSVNGSEVTLTLASPVQAGQTVSLDYTQPMSNPIQDASGNNKAQSFTRWYLVTDSTITKPAITVPGVPTDLSASTGGDTRINLSWTAPGDDGGSPITGYKIEVSPDGNANWTELVANTGNTSTTYAHIGLAVGTTRHYRVSAINSVGAGDPSNIDDATTRPITGPITGGGGGGGGGGPTPSEVDFEWNVKRDIEELDGGNDRATGVWSDGTTLWVADNADGADDSVYAYDLATGERVESREFALADTNRAPRGIWSDGETVWVSDSGRERLFAYRLADGERVEEREFALAEGNSDARGIWSDEETMWVLDGRADALFAYDFESGELLAEYALDAANDDPHGIWSDGVTIWVSDHGAKRLIAYRLPVLPDAETDSGAQGADDDARELERVRDEEFSKLSRASNNSPRGIWSDGDVMYVADESDDRVYSYNMPDAADARLASLTLSGVDIGEFDPGRMEYEAVVADGVTATTVEAEAMQRRTDVAIDPPDADVEADGHQVALQDLGEITVTVSSADGSRTKTYRVRLGEEEAAGPVAGCLRGDIAVGFSLVVYAGGSIEDLVACAEGRNVAALYVLDGGEWVSYILGAPEFVNRSFAGLFAEGLAALTPLIARSDGPASPDPSGDEPRTGDATQPWPACLQGEIAEGFNLVVYEEGSVGELEACAEGVGLAALYALSDGVWVFYIVGAPEFVNLEFRELFTDGVPSATPLVGKRDAP